MIQSDDFSYCRIIYSWSTNFMKFIWETKPRIEDDMASKLFIILVIRFLKTITHVMDRNNLQNVMPFNIED